MASNLLLAGVGERIGESVARRFHAAGWNVACVARSDDVIGRLADELDRVLAVRADVTDEEAVHRVVDETHEAFGPVDCLVCNASAGGGNPLDAADASTFERIWRVRALGSFLLVRACLDDLRPDGTVLFSGTTYATEPAPEQVEWGSAAPAVRGLAGTLDAALDGVHVAYVRIAAAVRPPDSEFPGAVGADAVADRYLELAESTDAVVSDPRIGPP